MRESRPTILSAREPERSTTEGSHNRSEPEGRADTSDDLRYRSGSVNRDGIRRSFERVELALQQCGIHEVPLTLRQVLAHHAELSAKKYQLHLGSNHQLTTIGFLQRGTGQHDRFAGDDPALDGVVQRLQPGSTIGIVERNAGTHLRHIRRGVKIVSIGKAPAQLLRERLAHRGLPYSTYAHEEDDHGPRSRCAALEFAQRAMHQADGHRAFAHRRGDAFDVA